MKGYVFSTVLVSWLISGTVYAAMYQNYTKVYSDIFKGYNINMRPVNDDKTVVKVSVDFVLLSVEGISESDQTITTNGWLVLGWQDEILQWDPSLYNDVADIQVQQKNVWKPDIVIKNTVKQRSKIGFDEQPVSLTFNGTVVWAPGDIFVTSCDLKVTYYPFDVQVCKIVVYLWISTSFEILLDTGMNNIDLSLFSKNGEWELVSTTSKMDKKGQFSEVTFEMKLKRRRQFFIVNVIVPILFLSCVGPLAFALPAESGEKMGYSVTVLLAYTVFLTIISDKMPQTSIQTAILSVYLTSMVSISALSVVLSAIVLRLHHKPEATKPPSKLQTIARVLRRILCFGNGERSSSVEPASREYMEKSDTVPDSKDKLEGDSEIESEVTWKMLAETLDFLFLTVATAATVLITIPSLTVMGLKGSVW